MGDACRSNGTQWKNVINEKENTAACVHSPAVTLDTLKFRVRDVPGYTYTVHRNRFLTLTTYRKIQSDTVQL